MSHIIFKTKKVIFLFLGLVILALLAIFFTQEKANKKVKKIDYNKDVRPIFSKTCFHCHGSDKGTREADFALHTFEYATQELKNEAGKYGIIPGDPENSAIIQRIYSEDPDELMPPIESVHKLTDEQKEILTEWVKQGAEYKEHWAFIYPQKTTPETEAQDPWVTNDIDRFIKDKHQELGLSPSQEADMGTWLRRVTLSLTGLQPTPQEIKDFNEALTTSPKLQAKEAVVDRLLASPRYGENMAISWIHAARFADTDGYQNDGHRENWPWRDYVIKAFNENKSFEQFTIEQIAGDMLENPTHEQLIATSFNRHHRQNAELGALPEEYLVENVLDRVETVGSIYFGFTMSCARCHDHKYDPLSQKEVFQFSSYFNNIDEIPTGRGIQAEPILHSPSLFANEENFKLVAKKSALRREVETKLETELEEIRKELRLTTIRNDDENDGRYERRITRLAKKKLVKSDELQKLEKELDQAAKLANRQPRPHSAKVMVMKEAPGIAPTYLLQRGAYDAPDKSEELTRTVPKILLGNQEPPKDRLELAQWIMSDKNPITARVIVNRMWQHFFGTGIVSTVEDFGSRAEFPTHPELLDWLAINFKESGWDMKAMNKLIVLSSTFAQSSKLTEANVDNKWLTRGPRFRLNGYVIRDQALHASGLLYEKLGGPSVKPYQPEKLWQSVAGSLSNTYEESKGKDLYRRSLYTYWKRAVNPPRQQIFDAHSREVTSVTVQRTNTPLQSLVLLNDKTFIEAAVHLTTKVSKTVSNSDEALKAIYKTAIGKEPNETMLNLLKESYSIYENDAKLNQEDAKLFLKGYIEENQYNDQLVALAMVAHTIFNLDEFITYE